ncbi:uncharacterized protein LOC105700835 [Orussus abietinus]|uniref:uncharacterized protein LOC105700835 n=1 Tax=Orussus abietinus TaxID=222816 RepID=UPI0006262D14|nr:uncharacterized protein LOC105700835 [Orussus abietinus]
MKEMLANQGTTSYDNHFATNNGDAGTNSVSTNANTRRYAVLSTEWISTIGEELGMHPLQDSLLKRLAEDASYHLREVLHKCVMRLRHSKRKRLTSSDVNSVISSLCDVDPVIGNAEEMPEYHPKAKVFVPHERFVQLYRKVQDPVTLSQNSVPFLQETEVTDAKLVEARHSYTKRALKTLFNGSQKTFQVLLNDCCTNAHLGGEGVVDKLISIARSMVISNNAQYTRVLTRTCQLVIAIASNSEAVYPYHLSSVDKLTELLLELLLGHSFINPNLEALFKECALKLMLRWPSVADRFVPMLEHAILREEKENSETLKRKMTAMELLVGVQPLIYYQQDSASSLSLQNILPAAVPGSVLWHDFGLSTCALIRSGGHGLDLSPIADHFGDSLIPYILIDTESTANKNKEPSSLPIIVRSKIKYANMKTPSDNRIFNDRQMVFPDSTLRGPRREIRFAFAGGKPVPPNELRRVSLRANYQILRSDARATFALVACRRLLVLRNKKKRFPRSYDLRVQL